MSASRRDFLMGLAAAGAAAAFPAINAQAASQTSSCPFRLAVINDEITEDFDRACQIASQDFGLQWIELRGMWGKNITELDAKQIDDARADPPKVQAPRYRHCQPALQDRLARRAPLQTQSEARPVPRRFRLQAAGRTSPALHRADQGLQHRPHPLLRLLASR